jgi:hypothetical protein
LTDSCDPTWEPFTVPKVLLVSAGEPLKFTHSVLHATGAITSTQRMDQHVKAQTIDVGHFVDGFSVT